MRTDMQRDEFAQRYLARIRKQYWKIEELKYAKYLEENGLLLSGVNYNKPITKGGKKKDLADIAIAVERYAEKINKEMKILYEQREAGKAFISLLCDDMQEAVLRYYYLDFMSWEQVAKHTHMSRGHVLRIRRIAVRKLNEIAKEQKIKLDA
jgi:hypothetical protein